VRIRRSTRTAVLRPHAAPRRIESVSERGVDRDELQAAIAARKELGPDMEPAVIDAFVERIERRLVERSDAEERALRKKRDHQKEMILGSLAIGIPLLAIAGHFTGLTGVVAVCAVLALIALGASR
jgi:hypothetical protein